MFRVSWLSVLLATAITIAIVQPARATTHHDTVPPTGTITMSDWQRFPDGCNPINPYNASDEELCASVWDNLFRLDSTLHYQADLSDGVPSTHSGDVQIVDGTTIVTYTLKPQLSWSDGSPLTMDDVVFSYDLNAALGNIEGIASIPEYDRNLFADACGDVCGSRRRLPQQRDSGHRAQDILGAEIRDE